MQIWIHDNKMKKIVALNNDIPDMMSYTNSSWHSYLDQATSTFDFTIPKFSNGELHEDLKLINDECFVSFYVNGSYQVFYIATLQEDDFNIQLTCNNTNLEYALEYANPFNSSSAQSIKWYLEHMDLLSFASVEIGNNEISDRKRTLTFDSQETKMARLQSLMSNFDAEFEFKVELNRDGTYKRIVINIYQEADDTHHGIGTDRKDVVLYYSNGLKGVQVSSDKTQIFNAGVFDGKNGVNLANVEFSEKNADGVEEFYSRKGDIFVYAPLSMQRYPATMKPNGQDNWIRKDFQTEYENVNDLKAYALRTLKQYAYPLVTYTASVQSGFVSHYTDLKLGDTIRIIDKNFVGGLALEARVSEMIISFDNPANNSFVFTNYRKLDNKPSSALQTRIEQAVESKLPYRIELATTGGVTFKNNEGETIVKPSLYKGNLPYTTDVSWRWALDGVVTVAMQYLAKASAIKDTAVLTVAAYIGNKEVATTEITLTNVNDGVDGAQGEEGPQGPQGPKGDKGDDGIAGKDGVGLKSTVVTYGLSTSETVKPIAWYPQVPKLTKGMYLWTETVWTYTDNTSETGYQKTYIAKDGNDGDDGLPGKDGVGIASTVITYAGSTSGTTRPTSGWTSTIPSVPDGQYLWTKTVWTYTDGTNETGYSVAKMGEKGEDGRGLERSEDFYQLTSTSTAPRYPDVGGRNLLKNSKTLEGSNISGTGTNLSEKYKGCTVRYIKSKNQEDFLQFSNCVVPEPGSTYTVSFWAKGTAPFNVYFYGNANCLEVSSGLTSQNVSTVSGDGSVIFTPTGSWERYWVTYKLKDSYPTSDTSVAKHLLFRHSVSATVETEQYIAGVKLESGKIPTDYTEAPEDLGWSTDVKVPTNDNRFLWKFSINYFSDGTVAFTPATLAGSMGAQGIQGLQGPKGDQGIPGVAGADGKAQYTHIAYADNATGGGFSQTDQNKAYIGMYVDFTATDSNDPTRYRWTKWKGSDGAQGIPGKPGADGKTPYIHFAYADDDKGTNFSLTDKNQQYQGYYSDYTEADSTDYRKYKWVDRLANVQVGGVNLYALSQNNSIRTKDISEFSQNISTGEISFKVTGPDPFFGDQANKGDAFGTSRGVKIPVKAGQGIAVALTNELLVKNYVSYFGEDNNAVKDFKNYQANKFVIPASELDGVSYVTFRFGFPEWSQEVGSVHKTKIKVEHGNIYTTWSPAPEDTQEQVDNKADQALTQDQLNALTEKNNLIKAEMEAKASMDTVNQWITAYQNYVKANDADKKKSEQALQDASNRLLQVKYDVNDLKQQWNFIDTYMSVQNEGLIIGKSDGSAYAKFSNDRISLFSGDSEVMYISQGTLNIANGIFTKTIQIGRFRFETHPNDADMLVVRFLGG